MSGFWDGFTAGAFFGLALGTAAALHMLASRRAVTVQAPEGDEDGTR